MNLYIRGFKPCLFLAGEIIVADGQPLTFHSSRLRMMF